MDGAAVEDVFTAFGPVRCRRMFGGLGIYAAGVMFALMVDDEIYLKTDSDFADTLQAEGSHPFAYEGRGRQVTTSYWSIPPRRIDDAEAVAEIAYRALRVAQEAAAKPAARRSRTGQKRLPR
ncbi:TfoX/Sxy family protein [Bosea sp. 117]|uniref:TfoX/Sxy family protein n=1 Tax=Bosea sp. 117 TaxID=1125973 RepID=UPI00049498D5|nr:TfoX/Sxy family protein [Bosea sp. 117]